MVINDENLRAAIIERIRRRAESADGVRDASEGIKLELELLAAAERENNCALIYRHLINLGNFHAVLKQPEDALVYFRRAADEFPDRRVPLYAVILTLKQLGKMDEAEKFIEQFERKFTSPDEGGE